MMTVHEVSRKTGVSVRALHHYDSIGLLPPAAVTDAGYRLYDEGSLARLQCVLLFRELEFPLKEIRRILDSPDFDRDRALTQQITLLQLRKEHIENLIALARNVQKMEGKNMDFKAFDTSKMDEYAAQAKESWGHTPAWKEYEQKHRNRSSADEQQIAGGLMAVLAKFHGLLDQPADCPEAQAVVRELKAFITANYYTCTTQILKSLGVMYGGGGSMNQNIDAACGSGTGAYAQAAIEAYREE